MDGVHFNDGAKCYHPMNKSRESLFLLGQHVTTDAGTGIVHTAPGHGHDDYVSWKAKQGELLLSKDKHRDSNEEDRIACPVDEFGTYNSDINDLVESSNSYSCNLQGLSVLSDGNSAVIQQLTDSGIVSQRGLSCIGILTTGGQKAP